MSTITVRSGHTLILDPSDKRVVVFDWDDLPDNADISSYTFTIAAVRQQDPDADLTKDNEDFVSGQTRQLQLRLLATTASVGDIYRLSNKIVTNETPAQEIEKSVRVMIQDQ